VVPIEAAGPLQISNGAARWTKQYYRQTGRRGAATLENMREVKCFHENLI